MTPARIVVPMKPLADAKSRLRGALPDDQRRLLSLAMLSHVLQTATAFPGAEVEVVGGDADVRAACRRAGARFATDTTADLNACLRGAFGSTHGAHVEGDGAPRSVLFLPADLPLVEPSDLDALAAPLESGRVLAIAPDRHNAGTNALAIRPPAKFELSMGESSFVRHLAALAAGGTSYAIVRSPGLGLDIDSPADLDLLLRSRPDWWDHARSLVAGPA